MRQVFNASPWIPPAEHDRIKDLFFTYGKVKNIKKNSIIKSSGEGNKLFFLKKGLCMYFLNYYAGKPQVLSLLPPNRSLCNLTCISGERVNVTTYAKRDSEILSMAPAILREHIRSNQVIADISMKMIIATQESLLEGMIANLTLTPEERLKVFFKSLLHSFDLLNNDNVIKIPVHLSNQDLGMVISVTRVTVSRIKKQWMQAGLYQKVGSQAYLHSSLLSNIYDWRDN
jgi:CRP-like cAMP-binding protein